MKKTLLNVVLIAVLLFAQKTEAVVIKCSYGDGSKSTTTKSKKFKRLYSNSSVKRNANQLKKQDDISITFENFTEHFEIGKVRILSGALSVNMNIGAINSGNKETWVLPDFSKDNSYVSYNIQQLEAEGTDIYDTFGYGTHVLYAEDLQIHELYDITDFDIYFVGSQEVDSEWWEYNEYEQTKSPTPIELGLEYTSSVVFGDDENPDNYIEYTDIYNVIGQGTLKTFDDGDADAMKMIYKVEKREFENGVEISYNERYEIVFYSKKGHYVTADITDPWNNEGEVTLSNINYHKLQSKTASTNDENLLAIKTFPNPVSKGESLTIESTLSLANKTIDMYNLNGQKVSTLNFANPNNNQYQTTIPETLASGLYFYKVRDNTGSILINGKIQIK